MATTVPVTLDTLITIKVSIRGSNRKFKVPLRELGANSLPDKLRLLLSIPSDEEVIFERYSDSAGAYITLDSNNAQVYKTLFRAAKAKLKLRLRATLASEKASSPSHLVPKAPEPSTLPLIPSARAAAFINSLNAHNVGPCVSSDQAATLGSPPNYTYLSMNMTTPPLQFGTIPNLLGTGPVPYVPSAQSMRSGPESERPANVPSPFLDPRTQMGMGIESLRCFPAVNGKSNEQTLAYRVKEPASLTGCSWTVYCNACDDPIAGDHFHCSVCDHGDYDLCPSCVDAGVHCPGDGHWLIKRTVQDGQVINSVTEKVAARPRLDEEPENEAPEAFTEEDEKASSETELPCDEEPSRTCNSCIKDLPEREFVTCLDCDDFDLCIPCHVGSKHGHHPGHTFQPATEDATIGALAEFLCAPGRNVRHAAVCDGCDKFIYGVRHKCLNCPDWDYCSQCMKNAKYIHPRHRFVPIYEPLPEPRANSSRHYGIYCDGPLCKDRMNQSYIEGVRYKCAVCHDTDFCANCEALPSNKHNRTHPLIKFKTPVRNVSVTTMGEDKNGVSLATMGDQPSSRSASTETVPVSTVNAATEVQTILDVKPCEEVAVKVAKEKIEIKDLLAEPIQEEVKVEDLLPTPNADQAKADNTVATPKETASHLLNAHYIRDLVADGTQMGANESFIQFWTLRNPGPHAWPAGCSVKYVGGDNMLDVDDSHPFSAGDIAQATESNIAGKVEVGEEVVFKVSLKTPRRTGTAISYWRLKAPDGTPFGHRLWCHVEVVDKVALPTPEPSPAPEHTSEPSVAAAEQPSASVNGRGVALEMPNAEETRSELAHSTMIFPTLEKESPASSTHGVAVAATQETLKGQSPPSESSTSDDDLEFFEDAESVEIMDASSEDSFLTDEEYDILDASDEEHVV